MINRRASGWIHPSIASSCRSVSPARIELSVHLVVIESGEKSPRNTTALLSNRGLVLIQGTTADFYDNTTGCECLRIPSPVKEEREKVHWDLLLQAEEVNTRGIGSS